MPEEAPAIYVCTHCKQHFDARLVMSSTVPVEIRKTYTTVRSNNNGTQDTTGHW